MNCRFCNNWRDQKMVKYGPRHYAHPRCYLEGGKQLKDLHDWQVVDFPARLLREFGHVDSGLKFVDPALRARADKEFARRALETV